MPRLAIGLWLSQSVFHPAWTIDGFFIFAGALGKDPTTSFLTEAVASVRSYPRQKGKYNI